MNTYIAKGDVCGSCNHKHRTIKGALDCAAKHGRAVKRGSPGGQSYSDRTVARADGLPLTEAEQAEGARILDARR